MNVIIQSYNLGNTQIKIADDYKLHSEEEQRLQIESFNRAGYIIMQNLIIKENGGINQ